MVSITHKDDQIVESKEITPISSPKYTYDSNSDELNNTDEEEVNVCDTCGVQGFTNKLAICDNCGVGAEHTYCMAVKLEDIPKRWSCNDCVEDTGSIKKNSKSSIDLEMGESGFRKQTDLITQKSSETSSSTSNFQAHTRMRASPNPLLGQGSLEEEEDHCAKRRRVDTRLSL
ncbi:hypothetical protein Bca52824_089066 [Brassica carinata]|uniref:PHD-type domain-containing protein n=1 Tax=Brassica carinata TaxID=52824 RepID=A0A8X7PEW4_BRACI|nr:hypothetical protein Bca52824_089066 [Brassica carinata]